MLKQVMCVCGNQCDLQRCLYTTERTKNFCYVSSSSVKTLSLAVHFFGFVVTQKNVVILLCREIQRVITIMGSLRKRKGTGGFRLSRFTSKHFNSAVKYLQIISNFSFPIFLLTFHFRFFGGGCQWRYETPIMKSL